MFTVKTAKLSPRAAHPHRLCVCVCAYGFSISIIVSVIWSVSENVDGRERGREEGEEGRRGGSIDTAHRRRRQLVKRLRWKRESARSHAFSVKRKMKWKWRRLGGRKEGICWRGRERKRRNVSCLLRLCASPRDLSLEFLLMCIFSFAYSPSY